MLQTGARAANRVRNLRGFCFLHHGQSVHELAVTPASLSAQPLWPAPAVPAATTAVLRHRYSRAHRHSCPSRRLQPPRRARRPRASARLKGAKWRAAGETWAPQAKLWRKCTVADLYFQRSGRHICPFVKRRSSQHFLFTKLDLSCVGREIMKPSCLLFSCLDAFMLPPQRFPRLGPKPLLPQRAQSLKPV